ncbi:hypothetical protein BRC62_00935, partial [Halobacteriales archaeon QH_10_67_13]
MPTTRISPCWSRTARSTARCSSDSTSSPEPSRPGRHTKVPRGRKSDVPDELNVLGTELAPCGTDPETGYLRDGYCHQLPSDSGRHELCAVVTEEFLTYSKRRGNDLVTPRPEFDFPGLDPGDRWCLCVG